MGFSPLAKMSRRIPDSGRSSPRNSKIKGFTIHHNAGVDAYGEATNPRRQVSANYWITNSGDILPNVDENRRAWTTGSSGYPAGAASDHRNITVEVSNSPTGVKSGTWAISPAAERALIALIGDVFKRHKLGKVKRGKNSGVAVHRDFVPTSCPGPYIMKNLSRIIKDAEKARKGKSTGSKPGTSKPAPAPSKPSKGKVGGEWPGNPLLVDGNFGPISRRAYQRLLAGIKRYKGRIDAHMGPLTVKAEQRWLKGLGQYKGRIDGIRGPLTVKALQRFLRSKGHYKGLIDGKHQTLTTKALQAYLNAQRKYF